MNIDLVRRKPLGRTMVIEAIINSPRLSKEDEVSNGGVYGDKVDINETALNNIDD